MTQLNRRTFLQSLGAAGAFALAPRLPVALSAPRAQAAPAGQVATLRRGEVTLHTYVAPDFSAVVTSHVIETPNALVVVDTQFLQTFARDFRAYVESLGKPVERVLLSHEHPDHYLGASVWADVPYHTSPTVAANVAAAVEGGALANLAGLLGESEVPTEAYLPVGDVTAGQLVVDGVTLEIDIVSTAAEAPETLVVRVPAAGALIVQDLVFNNVHFFPGLDRAAWIGLLEGLRADAAGYDTLLVGHGLPTSIGELDLALEYLGRANALVAEASTADDIIAGLQAQYPTFQGRGLLPFWAQFFQPT